MGIFNKDQITCESFGILGSKPCPICGKETVWILCVARYWFSFSTLRLVPVRKEFRAACSECKNGLPMSRATFDVLKMKLDCGDPIGHIEDAIRFPDKSALQIRELLKTESEEREILREMEEQEREELERVRAAEEEMRKHLSELEAEMAGEPDDQKPEQTSDPVVDEKNVP